MSHGPIVIPQARSMPARVLRSSDDLDGPGAVHVWSTRLGPPNGVTDPVGMLDTHERARAARFRFARDRDRYVARHVFLRQVLSPYLDRAPGRIRFRIEPGGKPRLEAPLGVDFSTSHSDGFALIAVTRSGRVGVDVERIRELDDALDLADSHLTVRERELVRRSPSASRSRAFLELWTAKEALVKALEVGLSVPPGSFDTGEPGPDGVRRPRGLPGDPCFSLVALDQLEGCVASLALEGERITIAHRSASGVVA